LLSQKIFNLKDRAFAGAVAPRWPSHKHACG
jgi:hypothetical protein